MPTQEELVTRLVTNQTIQKYWSCFTKDNHVRVYFGDNGFRIDHI